MENEFNPNKRRGYLQFDSQCALTFNNSIVYLAMSQSDLGIIFDNRLSIEQHQRLVFSKIDRTIGLLHKVECLIPRSEFINIFKTFV